jgi:hypothetical protein
MLHIRVFTQKKNRIKAMNVGKTMIKQLPLTTEKLTQERNTHIFTSVENPPLRRHLWRVIVNLPQL